MQQVKIKERKLQSRQLHREKEGKVLIAFALNLLH